MCKKLGWQRHLHHHPERGFLMFTKQETDTGTVWMHDSGMIWIRHYDLVSRPFFQAYRALKKPKAGQMPWAVNNKRISEEGFATLDEAMQEAEQSFEAA
jgi:hypothetical protein